MLGACLDAAELLAADGIEATVWDPRVVKPLDPDLLDDAARFDHVVTVEDGLREGGIGSAIADEVADPHRRHRPQPPRQRAGRPRRVPRPTASPTPSSPTSASTPPASPPPPAPSSPDPSPAAPEPRAGR